MSLACGIDVGGTKIAGGVVDETGSVLEELQVTSPATDAHAIEAAIEKLVSELAIRHKIEAVGVGAAGYIDKSRSVVLFAPNLAWRDLDLKADLETTLGLPVVVENDANAAACSCTSAAAPAAWFFLPRVSIAPANLHSRRWPRRIATNLPRKELNP